MSTDTRKVWSIDDIQTAMRANGSHWWNPDTMRFFGTRVCGPAWNGPGGVYFVTSEKPPHGARAYTVRQYKPETYDVDTVGELCGYKCRDTAIRAARKAAGADDHRNEHFQPVTDFDQFLYNLARHGCANVRPSQARELIRLGKRHAKLMEDHCNGRELYDADGEPLAVLRRNRQQIDSVCAAIGCKALYQGDPRGVTVKLILSDGFANDWGKEGLCVPGA